MHLEFLVEEYSMKILLDTLIPKIIGSTHTYHIHDFRSKMDLLKNLEARLKGYAKINDWDFRIVVLVDEDRQDCIALKKRMTQAAEKAGISDIVLNRIVVEELEAWFFGDLKALRLVYPRLPSSLANQAKFRNPDQISGGTWESLDKLLQKYGYPQGLIKIEVAQKIAKYMNPEYNRSKSFQVFRQGILRLVSESKQARG